MLILLKIGDELIQVQPENLDEESVVWCQEKIVEARREGIPEHEMVVVGAHPDGYVVSLFEYYQAERHTPYQFLSPVEPDDVWSEEDNILGCLQFSIHEPMN